MNCATQDASNLGWKLALVLKNYAQPALLASYNDERLPVIAQMLQATTALYTHTVPKEKPSAALEQRAGNESTSGWFRWRNAALQMYGINYRYSNIVLEERNTVSLDKEHALAQAYSGYEGLGVLQAGDRAPEAPGLVSGDEGQLKTSLFELYQSTIHTVLVFAAEGQQHVVADIIAAAQSYPKDIVQTMVISGQKSMDFTSIPVFVDSDGHARSGYLMQEDAVCLWCVLMLSLGLS